MSLINKNLNRLSQTRAKQPCIWCVQKGFVAAPSVPDGGVQDVPAFAGLSVNDNLNQTSLMLFENHIKPETRCAQLISKISALLDNIRLAAAQTLSRMSKKTKLYFMKVLLNRLLETWAQQRDLIILADIFIYNFGFETNQCYLKASVNKGI